MTKLSPITIRRLRAVKRAILTHPKRYYQGTGGPAVRENGKLFSNFRNECNTAACILGWANALFPANPRRARAMMKGLDSLGSCRFPHGAARLNLSADEAQRLWADHRWPEPFRSLNTKLKEHGVASAKNAARRIDHFIKTNGAE